MEKELGVPKPGDLLIGVIDLFAVLVPGLIATALIMRAIGWGSLRELNTVLVCAMAVAGWVIGHVLHGIGSWLDPLLYDPLFKPRDADTTDSNPRPKRFSTMMEKYFHKNDELYILAKRLTDSPNGPGETSGQVPGGMYQWARAWLNSHNPKATADLDRLEADSKLFRSLAVIGLILIPVLILKPESLSLPTDDWLMWIVLDFAGVLFSLWRYCDLRNKMIRQCYLNYVQLRSESQR